jgi:pimeloyl-ACP methyl ester carboxylesterase
VTHRTLIQRITHLLTNRTTHMTDTTLPTTATETTTPTAPKPTVVFVHGAWSDATPFSRVRDLLTADGYTVVNFANPLRSLHADTDYLSSFIEHRTTGPVVLVGHSYGGALISSVAHRHPDVQALVFLNAFVPAAGETILGLSSKAGPVDAGALFDMVHFGEHDVDLYLKPGAFAGGFANGLTTADVNRYSANQRPITYGALNEPADADQAWQTLPSWYLAGDDDHSIAVETQVFMAERAGSHLVRVAAGHLAMVVEAHTVADLIREAAAATR